MNECFQLESSSCFLPLWSGVFVLLKTKFKLLGSSFESFVFFTRPGRMCSVMVIELVPS